MNLFIRRYIGLSAIFLLAALSCLAAPQLNQTVHNRAASVTTLPVTFTSVQAGDLLVLAVRANGISATSISGVSDNVNGAWSSANTSTAVVSIADNAFQLWFYPNSIASKSLTVTVAISASGVIDVSGQDWSGIVPINPLDQAIPPNNTQTSAASSYPLPAITTENTNDLVIAWAGNTMVSNAWSINQGFTLSSFAGNPATNTQMAYIIAPSVGTYSPAFNAGAAKSTGTAGIAAFKSMASASNQQGAVQITPAITSLEPGQSQQFAATVPGQASNAVTWAISPGLGSISGAGLYVSPAGAASPQTVTITATSVANSALSGSINVTIPSTLQTFSLSELFGEAWPNQTIEFRYDGGQPSPASTRMIGPLGAEVPYQWVSSCSDATAVKGCIAVQSNLPASSSYTWTLQSGVAPAATPVNPVQLQEGTPYWTVSNGLAGVRIIAPGANPAPFNIAPIQGIELPNNGGWTGAGASPNLLYAETATRPGCIGCVLTTPMFDATGYTLTVADNGPMKVVLNATYTFNRPGYSAGSTVINTPGQGHYTLIVTMYAGSKSVLIDEDSDMQFSYYLPVYAQLQPTTARWRGHDAMAPTGQDPRCGYESPLTVTAASDATPIVVTATLPAGGAALSAGQMIEIAGVLGNTAANGIYFAQTAGQAAGKFALYLDAGLTKPVAGTGAYTGGGVVKPGYRGQSLTPTPDGFIDLTYNNDRPASYMCSDVSTFSYRKLLSDYPAASPGAPWYVEFYNASAGSAAPIVGFYTGRASKQVFSATGPSMPGIYTSNKHFITGAQAAGIQVDNLLRGPDGTTTALVHRNWGIYVSTQADLQQPSLHQPIGNDENALTGINLSRLYTYQLVYPDPPGGWQWLYLSPTGASQLESWVQNGTSVCGSQLCYANLLEGSEGSAAGLALVSMWQGDSAAAVQTALNNSTGLAHFIETVLVAGDNHLDDNIGYYQLGLNTSPQTAVLNAILMNANATPAQKTMAKACLALFGSLLWDDDWFPIENNSGESVGLANQIQQYLEYRTQAVAAAPSQPYLASMVSAAASYPAADFNQYFSATGAAAGSTHYQSAFFEPLVLSYLNFSLDGTTAINGYQPPMSDPKWTAYANWELSIQTPPEPRFGGSTNPALGLPMRKGYSNGDGNTEADVRTGMLGTALEGINPALSSNLMWAWQASNSKTVLTEDAQFITTLAVIDPSIPPVQPTLTSTNIPGYHSVERFNFGTANETALWFINGGFYSAQGHRHFDDGQVSIYADAAPLAIDFNANLYYPSTAGRFMHNSIVYDSEIGLLWSADQPGLESASELMNNPANTEFGSFAYSTTSTATFSYPSDGTIWTRTARTMNFDQAYPIIYVTDSFSGPSAGTGKTLTWNMMATGAVTTPAGSITPTLRFSAGCQTVASALPSNGVVSSLAAGLNHFNFTGFPWPKHAAGGIDWDLFVVSGDATQQFMIGNWGHGCQSGREMNEYQAANGAAFAEVQDILRVHDTGSFATIIMPYPKTGTPARTVTQQACGVQVVQTIASGSETTCFNGSMAQYSNGTTSILTVYDSSTQSAFGVTAAGGPQEVAMQAGQVTWTISGVESGSRTLTLPGNWSPNQQLVQANGAWTYNFAGGQQAAPVTVVFTVP